MRAAGTPSASSEGRGRRVPDGLRARLAERYGPVLSGEAADARFRGLGVFATCGDRVTTDAIRVGNLPLLAIVDLATRRSEPVDASVFRPLADRGVVRVRNPAGILTDRLRAAVRAMVSAGGGLVVVDGEEDLGALALVESLPVGATVIYGIPGEGASFVTVDDAAKERVRALIDAMEEGPVGDGA
ncbi:MAG TPA: DUF359 domain-containing protein [Thermoplasmata archaeon]|nr:DUF359 domain-containing protein [Thermoplasmata archaeon]HUJ77962.1 DUF359 domain-containing protein [Thermoplasmata archaeon]